MSMHLMQHSGMRLGCTCKNIAIPMEGKWCECLLATRPNSDEFSRHPFCHFKALEYQRGVAPDCSPFSAGQALHDSSGGSVFNGSVVAMRRGIIFLDPETK